MSLSRHGVWVVVLSASIGAPAHAEDLVQIYELAKQHDTAWAAARARHRASAEKAPQGRALLLPEVIFTASTTRISQERTAPNTSGVTTTTDTRFTNSAYSLQLTQPLFRKQNLVAYEQGKINVTQADAELAIARQELMLRSARAYFDVLAAQDRLSFARSEKAAITAQRELAERNFSVGNATIVDVHEARARFDLARAEEVAAESNLQVKLEALLTLIHARPGELARLRPRLELNAPQPDDSEHWVTAATQQNPQIQVQQYRRDIARAEVERQRGGHYPNLDLVASHNYSDLGGSAFGFTSETTSNQVGLQLLVPIYSGGAVNSRTREAAALLDESEQRLEQARRDVTRRTRESFLAVTSGMARVQALEQARTSTKKALESTQLGYETGVRTQVDVLNAQRDLFRTERDLSQARYDYLISRLELKNAAGTLSEDDLSATNALLAGQ